MIAGLTPTPIIFPSHHLPGAKKREDLYLASWLGRVWSEQAVIITPGDAELDCQSVLGLMRARGFIVTQLRALH